MNNAAGVRGCRKGGRKENPGIVYETLEDKKRKEEQKKVFVEGLRRYQSLGVTEMIDGMECSLSDYEKLFTAERGAFYMGDYIGDERGNLKGIHFDKVRYK